MKTAQEVISDIQQLAPEDKQIVVDYVISNEEDAFKITEYSKEDLAELDRRYEEAKQGINVERYTSMKDAIKSLGLEQADIQ